MRLTRVVPVLLVVFAPFALIGCLSGGGGGGDSGATSSTPPASAITTGDFFHLAVVPDQTVTTATFEVQVIAENIDPTSPPSAPIVVDGNGTSHTMALKTLKWPGTAVDSVAVYSATIPLKVNQINTIKAVSGTKQLPFSIRHKAALTILTASNSAELITHIKTGIGDPSIDVVEANYNEPDLGPVINGVGNGVANNRVTWLTVRPAAGKTISYNRDYPGVAFTNRRPQVDFLNLSGIVFGSDTSDGGGYQLYTEVGYRLWLSGMEFRAKYKASVPKATTMTPVNYLDDVRFSLVEGQKIYLTDCLWDGTAPGAATSGAELARDLRFNSLRGDFNNFGKVFLNATGQDVAPIRNNANTDFLHNDGFQIWGNVGTNNIVLKGLKITSPTIPADVQPFLLDTTFSPNYSYVLLDSIVVEGADPALKAFFAGVTSNSRISNMSFPVKSLVIVQNIAGASAFTPTNVRIHNFDIKAVEYFPPVGPGTTYSIANGNTVNPANISPELNAIPGLSGAVFSNIKLN